MAKKPKNENISDIIDRIEEDLITLRDKVEELENHECDTDDNDFEDEDEDEQIVLKIAREIVKKLWLSQQEFEYELNIHSLFNNT